MNKPNKEYNRKYHLKRYHKRRKEVISRLGGKCVKCGSIENLEIDHIDPDTKVFNLGKLWSPSKEIFELELAKCQLLCKDCHINKTFSEGDGGRFWCRHGTYSMYRHYKCRCEECRTAERKQRLRWKSK